MLKKDDSDWDNLCKWLTEKIAKYILRVLTVVCHVTRLYHRSYIWRVNTSNWSPNWHVWREKINQVYNVGKLKVTAFYRLHENKEIMKVIKPRMFALFIIFICLNMLVTFMRL